MNEKTFLALDNYSVPMAEEIMDQWKDKVAGFKLNHVLYEKVNKQNYSIFCDYKLFDIPNTMESVIQKLINDGVEYTTVFALNSVSALHSLEKYADKIKLLGVVYLTSWDTRDVLDVTGSGPQTAYWRACKILESVGFHGVICSPKDIPFLGETKLKKVCPGIRKKPLEKDDQKRIVTPEEAIELGADYLVMGRSFFD